MMYKKIFAVLLLISGISYAQDESAIYLEGIEVIDNKETTEYITQEQIGIYGTSNLWEIMGKVPGVTLTAGSQRNESNFRIRGFDAGRVPVYIDGVSQAVPYRGEADHGRILTYDLESIEVQKGYSSMLMGSGNLGGLVNLVTAKPKKSLEASIRYETEFDSIFKHQQDLYVVSAGSRQQHWYAKFTGVYMDQSHFRMSNKFSPLNDYQLSKQRNDSKVEDTKLTVIAGITPTEYIDASLTYVRQRADKQAPGDIQAPEPRIWDWPKWNRDTLSFNASYTPGGRYLKLLTYYDKYMNRLYTERPYTYPSDYDDYAVGTKLQGGYDFNKNNNLQLSAMWKSEVHKAYDNVTYSLEKEMEIEEHTYSFGAEYSTRPLNGIPATFVFGLGYDMLKPRSYWTVYKGKQHLSGGDTLDAFLYQAGMFYDVTEDHELHLTFSRKAHFPSMSERFSTRFDTVLPNPDLKPEYAYHYELGYKGNIKGMANLTTALYFSDFRDKIFTESVRDPATGQTVNHSVNKDKWQYYGLELSAEVFLSRYVMLGGALSYNMSKSKYEDVRMAYYPQSTANVYALVMPADNILIIPRYEYTNQQYTSTDPSNHTKLGEYYLFHCSVKLENILDYFYAEVGVNNIFDRYYEYRQYFPAPGRVYSLTLGGSF